MPRPYTDINLDSAHPAEVPVILRKAAQSYRESTAELQAAWQDDQAGMCWTKFADELDKAADSCEAVLTKYFK